MHTIQIVQIYASYECIIIYLFVSVYMTMNARMCMYEAEWAWIYVLVHACVCAYVCMSIYVCSYVWVCTYVWVCMCIYVYVLPVQINACMHVWRCIACMFIVSISISMCACNNAMYHMYVCAWIAWIIMHFKLSSSHTCIWYMHIHAHICIHT